MWNQDWTAAQSSSECQGKNDRPRGMAATRGAREEEVQAGETSRFDQRNERSPQQEIAQPGDQGPIKPNRDVERERVEGGDNKCK